MGEGEWIAITCKQKKMPVRQQGAAGDQMMPLKAQSPRKHREEETVLLLQI